MAEVSNDADGLPVDQYGNNLPIQSEDEETHSLDLLTPTDKEVHTNVVKITPDKMLKLTEDNEYMFPMERVKRRALLLLPNKPPKVVKVKKLKDPKPTVYFPEELSEIDNGKECIHCNHTTCHDNLYGDFCGLQATEYAKKRPKGKCTDVMFESKFIDHYTSSLKFHRYLSTGVIDMTYKYELPDCMKKSSYRNFFAIFKIDRERIRLNRALRWSDAHFAIRTEPYIFDNEEKDE